jgi:hypothetical protein
MMLFKARNIVDAGEGAGDEYLPAAGDRQLRRRRAGGEEEKRLENLVEIRGGPAVHGVAFRNLYYAVTLSKAAGKTEDRHGGDFF